MPNVGDVYVLRSSKRKHDIIPIGTLITITWCNKDKTSFEVSTTGKLARFFIGANEILNTDIGFMNLELLSECTKNTIKDLLED